MMTLKRFLVFAAFVGPMALIMAVGLAPERAAACKSISRRSRPDPKPTMKQVAGRWEVKLSFYRKYYRFKGSNYRLQQVTIFTRSKTVASFLVANGRGSDLWHAVYVAAQTFSCEALQNGKRLVALEQAMGKAVAAWYRKKSRKVVGALDTMLVINQNHRPYCNPPSKPTPRP